MDVYLKEKMQEEVNTL